MTSLVLKLNFVAVASLIFLSSAHAGKNEVIGEARCTGAKANSALCRTINHAYKAESAFGSSCEEKARFATNCCGQWNSSASCMGFMDRASAEKVDRFIKAASTGGNPAPNDPSIFGSASEDKTKNQDSRDAFEAMEGVCRVARDSCMSGCNESAGGEEANNHRMCYAYQRHVDGFKAQAANFSNAIAQNEQQQQNTGSKPGGDSSNNGGSGSDTAGNNTKPQSQQGQGQNPLSQLASALGQAMQPKPKQQQEQMPLQDCQSNPALAGCPAAAAASDSWNPKAGEAEMKDPGIGETGGENFNVASTESGSGGYNGNGEQRQATPISVSPVPGGGGGGIGGASGGGSPQAGGNQPNYGAAAKSLTDVMHGTMSGGYAQTNAAMQMQNGAAGGGFSGYGGSGGDQFRGMDLRQFLPGGKNDPTRKLAGGNAMGAGAGTQIQSQSVNIWNRISERIKSRCSQGLLRDCIP